MDIDNYIRNLSTEELLDITEELLDILTSDQKKAIYDAVNYELKKENVLSILEDKEDIPNVLKDDIACDVAEMWKSGDYDCNLSYWDNINNLIEESVRKNGLQSDKDTYKKFYFTFGSDPAYPHGIDDYVAILAKNRYEAQMAFKATYPNRPGSDCLNYAFDYTEGIWEKDDLCAKYYNNKPPIETIIATDELVAKGKEDITSSVDMDYDTDYEY